MFKRGAKVDADFGDGYQIAFVLSGPHGDDEKYTLQPPGGGSVTGFAHREPADVEASGGQTGLTFKAL